ncbi:MAG: glycosyltransferase [Alphaproteobacteria bacterium]|nr:glycosyltransferase [Alphaproteobacteria bacterium]
MRVLAVSYMLPPALYPQAIQIGQLLEHLPAEIATVSGAPNASSAMAASEAIERRLAFRLTIPFRPGLSGVWLELARRVVPFYARVPDEFRRWVPRAERALLMKLNATGFRPDVLATFGEPMSDHLLGLRLKRRLGLPWLAHFSDPWADNPFRRFQPLANLVNRRLERRVIASADRLVFTSSETLDLMIRKYPNCRGKASVVPHSFDPALYPRAAARRGPLMVRYLGNFYGHRTPFPLLAALKRILSTNQEILTETRFELVGGLSPRLELNSAWNGLPQGLVARVPTVHHHHALALMAESDLLLVIDAPSDLSVFLPSKLVEYLGAGVPVMGIVPSGASARLIKSLGGIVADPRDINAVAAGLVQALEMATRWRASDKPWGDASVRDLYRIDCVADKFADLLHLTCATHAERGSLQG